VSDLLIVVCVSTIPPRRRRNLYFSDFGGNREAADGNDPAVTAGREFAEETLGMFGGVGVDQASVAASSVRMAGPPPAASPSLLHQYRGVKCSSQGGQMPITGGSGAQY